MLRLLFLLSSFFYGSFAFSQSDSTDLKALFDDDEISTAKTVVKINPTALLASDLPVTIERLFLKHFTVEFGAGIILDMPSYELSLEMTLPRPSLGRGFSLWLNPRLYLSGKTPEGYYIGLLYRHRNFSSGIIYNDYAFNNGMQLSLLGKGRVMVDMMYGVGFRFFDSTFFDLTGINNPLHRIRFIFPGAVKIGYKF